MKKSLLLSLVVGLALIAGISGCKRKSTATTPIPGTYARTGDISATRPTDFGGTMPTVEPVKPGEVAFNPNSQADAVFSGPHDEDYEALKADTVYFDTDSAAIKKSEQSKLQNVFDYFKANPTFALKVEGHCDERGTEGYNLALGDKRALAVREYLATLGLEAGKINTISYGESKPAAEGHDEAAWKENRRAVFLVGKPK